MNWIRSNAIFSIALLLLLYLSNSYAASEDFGPAVCERKVTESSINAIINEVFNNKVRKLNANGLISDSFWVKNRELKFVVCDNAGSYDTFVLYGTGVVFDYQMVAYLFAQSRALIVGRYISISNQFDVHNELVRQFIKQTTALNSGPLAIIESKAIDLGMGKEEYQAMLSKPDFQRREQTFFLQALYFLSMHERCHVALDHGTQLEEISQKNRKDRFNAKQQLELQADQCALDIINGDEAQYKDSPIAFFGALMTAATQAIVSNVPSLTTHRSHPSTKARIGHARDTVLQYISESNEPDALSYEATIRATAEYFQDLLADL